MKNKYKELFCRWLSFLLCAFLLTITIMLITLSSPLPKMGVYLVGLICGFCIGAFLTDEWRDMIYHDKPL